MKSKIWVVFFNLIFCCKVASADINQSLPLLVKKIKPAIVSIEVYNAQRESIRVASGFIMNAMGLVATNWHVMNNAFSANVKTAEGVKFEVKGIVAEDPLRDLAIIAIKAEKANFPFIKLSKRSPEQGEQILVMGNPYGLEFTLSDGLVSAIRSYKGFLEIIQISAPISPGSSGSAIIDFNGEVLAIASFGWAKGQNLNFGIGSTHLYYLYQKAQRNLESVKSLKRSDKVDMYLQIRKLIQVGVDRLIAEECRKALSVADQVVRLIPESSEGYVLRGAAYQCLEEYTNALPAMNKAIEIDTEEPNYYMIRGTVLTRMRKFKRALEDHTKAITMRPQAADFYAARSFIFAELGDNKSALQDINRAITLRPSGADFYVSRAACQTTLGKTSQAVADLKKALQLYPDKRERLAVQGILYLTQGERKEAIECIQKAARMGHKGAQGSLNEMGIQW